MSRGYGKRLRVVRELLGLTQKGMAEYLGASFRSYQSYEREDGAPKITHLMVLQKNNISIDWLLSGEGSMILGPTEELGPRTSQVNVGVLRLIIETVLEEMEGFDGQPFSSAIAAQMSAVLYRQLQSSVTPENDGDISEDVVRQNVEDLMSVLALMDRQDTHGIQTGQHQGHSSISSK